MKIINLVEGDISPVIVLTVDGTDLQGKLLQYWCYPRDSCDPVKLDAFLQPDGTVQVPVMLALTQAAGRYRANLVVVGEQTVFEQQIINVRSLCNQ